LKFLKDTTINKKCLFYLLMFIMRNKKLEKSLLNALPKERFKARFEERLNNVSYNNYWQIISEMRAIYIFNNILKTPVEDIEVLTVGRKNVDFVANYNTVKIYVEVKGFKSVDEIIAKKGGSIGSDDEKIDRALNRSIDKFLKDSCNIVVIADENTTRLPLFMNELTDLKRIPETYLNSSYYEKVSAIMILGGMYKEQLYNYKIHYNNNPTLELPDGLKEILNSQASN